MWTLKLFFHVDITIEATEEVAEVVVSAANQIIPTKHLGEVEWHMGSEYKREREKGTLEIRRPSSLGVYSIAFTSRSPAPSPLPLLWTSGT